MALMACPGWNGVWLTTVGREKENEDEKSNDDNIEAEIEKFEGIGQS
jgi:hypothetical protein